MFVKLRDLLGNSSQMWMSTCDLRSRDFFPAVWDIVTFGEHREAVFRTLVERFYNQPSCASTGCLFHARARLQRVGDRWPLDFQLLEEFGRRKGIVALVVYEDVSLNLVVG